MKRDWNLAFYPLSRGAFAWILTVCEYAYGFTTLVCEYTATAYLPGDSVNLLSKRGEVVVISLEFSAIALLLRYVYKIELL